MKIKSDFITNSSSTSYIAFIPKDFHPTDEEIQTAIKSTEYMFNEYVDNIQLKNIINIKEKYFEDLKNGYCIDESCDGERTIAAIIYICHQHEFILTDIENGVGGFDQIIGIKEKVINKILLTSFTNNLKIIEVNDE